MTPRFHREVVQLHHQLSAAYHVPAEEHSNPDSTHQLYVIARSRLAISSFSAEARHQHALIAVFKARSRFPERSADRLAKYTAVIAKHMACDACNADQRSKYKRGQERDLEPDRQRRFSETKPERANAYTARDAWLDTHELRARGLWKPRQASWAMLTQEISAAEAAHLYRLHRVTTWRHFREDMAWLNAVVKGEQP